MTYLFKLSFKPKDIEIVKGKTNVESPDSLMIFNDLKITQSAAHSTNDTVNVVHADLDL